MKKMTAMLLVLCMLLTAVPALGEEGPGGYWYVTLADVTVGYIMLNEDGTASVSVAGEEITGTWTAGGETVTITSQGDAVDFVYDGSSLRSDALQMNAGREAGRLPMETVLALVRGDDYELPEGMAAEEAAAIALAFLAEAQKAATGSSDAGSGQTAAAGPAAPPAGNAVTVVRYTFGVTESGDGFRGTYIARIRNDHDYPLFVTGGGMSLLDAENNQVAGTAFLDKTGSTYLEPGETSFVSMCADLKKDGVYTPVVSIESQREKNGSTDSILKVTDPVFVKGERGYDDDLMKATVVNETDIPRAGIRIVLVLLDAGGNLLDIETQDLGRNELGGHSSITLVSAVDGTVKKYYESHGIGIAAVEAYAWAENGD